ncbi:hypothetical protein A2643_03220 [Candidatus Nomurabacteria bacterium RIFCSPHIGHO2_01_FULL_39_220]|uniref:tRNA N6-adenosine threonylcarbamoyltransferase n=1 Tax=Candidatus Nomurabacteria bacterium RIFCSPLOWO2_02_FULL_40_67 TaxID=1801787 RepID=A0A1F6Y4V4_9BACT|nr:MAG: putative tRNA threonylcarbamoyladenosine biosynthesis protein Gcp [Parcubacteria group bacterium GW2011_GWA2_40_37]KKS11137.1 MAG: putative tRNA threonylcarbamoyladenosine biosynthesis protein Gcp [Parcubacteria group bacterium GW2011_GWB1_41_5]KKS72024.1 MAG: putative tRNA threonylcarbamoyladenosine biosynthesis protein Gcp [Parcubacteria group bacterium GW2011_GWF2_42_7]OGI62323.1 MAG: hypothetical protein A2W12_03780 [Candidatus Nomurabacteria bacterium RBG_16_40_11]OGI70646.1 MAG: h
MKILSIETSCDDTCISIMEAKGGITNASFKVLANNSNSQINIHIPYGGVYPVLAKREHAKNLPIILEANLKQARLDQVKAEIDAIAVTYGPGLEMCLWEGITFAKDLAQKWNVPLIPTNHMEGHVLSVFGKRSGKFKIPKIKFPALSLLVSGGHTQLVLSKKFMQYEIIGETLDDAVGETFDKVARMLDLPYPGGPQISKLAEEIREKEKQALRGLRRATVRGLSKFSSRKITTSQSLFSFSFPRPMLHSKNFDFSFAGLKTAVLYLIRKIGKLDKKIKSKIALEFENAAIECLVYKTQKAIEKYKIKTLIVAGGVACNRYLQREMKRAMRKNIKLLFPEKGLAGDNSLMIGIAGYLNYIKNNPEGKNTSYGAGKNVPKLGNIKAVGNLRL